MSSYSGFLHFYDLIGLDRASLRVHYRFEDVAGTGLANSAPNYPQFSGALSSTGQFWNISGSGLFTGQRATIAGNTGLVAENWTHIFVAERTGRGAGILVDTLMTGEIYSGYVLGINDNNRLYMESFGANGPYSKTSEVVLGKKNLVAFARGDNTLTFYCYDFNNHEAISDSKTLDGQFLLSSSKASLGNSYLPAGFIENRPFTGYLDDYIFLAESLTPTNFRYLASGLAANHTVNAGAVTSFTTNEITGFSTGVTGVTGITGYVVQVTGSGLDPFGTGDYEYFYGTVGQTGYLSSGLSITSLTGLVTHYVTGDSSVTISINTGFTRAFNLDEVSFVRKIDSNDVSAGNVFVQGSPVINLEAGYDFIESKFQLDDAYPEESTQVYLNGVAQIPTGYTVTGNLYGSGVVLSGDYRIDGFYLDSTGRFASNDGLIYDRLSGAKQLTIVTGALSGATGNITLSGAPLVFFNGILLLSGQDYTGSGSVFQWSTNRFDAASGVLAAFPMVGYGREYFTGTLISITGVVPRRNSQVFLNGQRQRINENYIENSTIDLLGQSGIFENTLDLVYNNPDTFFE